ncbi:MAG: LLM class flavin-dependent oxidoreductase [Dehalococcoidia bacterium]
MPKRLAIGVGGGRTPAEHEQAVQRVQIADEVGVESVWSGEAWSRDAFTTLTELAAKTQRIGLGTNIVNVYSRSAGLIAMTAATLDQVSGGRLTLGLGSSGANVIEHLHGIPFEKPLRRLREYVEIINLLMAGEPLNYDGEIFHLQRGFTFRSQGFTPLRPHIPIYIAAITPASIRQTAQIADGIIPIYWPKEHFATLAKTLAEEAAKAGRPADAVTIAPQIQVYLTDAVDEEEQRQRARHPIAYYIGRMGRFYAEMLARFGFEEEVAKVQAATAERDLAAAHAAVSDRLVDATAIIGPLDACAEQLDERRALGGALPILNFNPQPEPERARTVYERLLR